MEDSHCNSKNNVEDFLSTHKRALVWILCSFAMLRVFFFCAAFPFFNNVDETVHFDMVVKYSKGYLPNKDAINYDPESAELILLYGSPEYFSTSDEINPANLPLWRYDRAQISQDLNHWIYDWTKTKNHEAFSPPVYYSLAGLWYLFGKLLHLNGGQLLYWIRFLNVPLYAILFLFIFLFCKNVYNADVSMQFSILLLCTVFPQDVFYSINSDVLSPLFCLISFYMLFQIFNADKTLGFYFLTGIVVAAAFLVKFSNFPVLIIFSILIFYKIRLLFHTGKLKERLPHLLLLVSGCALPIIFWLGWNSIMLGDMTGMAGKARDLGWTVKPFAELWNHPIFTLDGSTHFFSEMIKTFWRGEFVWGLQRLCSAPMDMFYVLSTIIFVPVSIIYSITSKNGLSHNRKLLNYTSALILFFSLLFFALLSIVYDFGQCWYPSRILPFFTSGRLMLGALVPFLILYIDGLRIIVSKINDHINIFIIVLIIGIAIMYSEIHLTYQVLESNYNWFHLF